MVAVDEGIIGYRKESLEVVYKLQQQLQLDLKVISFKDRFGRTLDELVQELHKNDNTNEQKIQHIQINKLDTNQNLQIDQNIILPNVQIEDQQQNTSLACSYCGILRRNALTAGAHYFENPVLATGHNADDQAETVLLNLMRGDISKLKRCVDDVVDLKIGCPKIKPFARQAQKDIVLYVHFANVSYFSTECPYAVTAQRGVARRFINKIHMQNKQVELNIIDSVQDLTRGVGAEVKECPDCRAPLIGNKCQACEIRKAQSSDELKSVLKTNRQVQ